MVDVQMCGALVCCGFSNQTSNFMIAQGFGCPEDLLLVKDSDIDIMIRNSSRNMPDNVQFPFLAVRKLCAFWFWVEECNRTGEDLFSASFNDAAVTEYTHKLRHDEHEMDAAKSKDPSKPEALKATKDRMKWFEKFKNYLGQIKGAARIPLIYIIRNHLEVHGSLRNSEYGSTLECLIVISSLNRMHFEIDNKQVWQKVKALVIDGFGWSYIKQFEKLSDGRGAVLALFQQCEGGSYLHTCKNAYLQESSLCKLERSSLLWTHKAYTYQQYVALHQHAHNELEDCNEAVPETKKVADFLAWKNCPLLQMGLNIVMSDPMRLSNFDATQQVLGTLVANQTNQCNEWPNEAL
jgi:hypothetical protein